MIDFVQMDTAWLNSGGTAMISNTELIKLI